MRSIRRRLPPAMSLPAWGGVACTMIDSIDGNLSAGNAVTSNADGLIEFVVTTLGDDNTHIVEYRRQDATNRWRCVIVETGQILLQENITLRANSAVGAVVNGDRICIVTSGTVHRIYADNVLEATHTSATYQSATGGRVAFIDAPGALADLKSWPLGCPAADAAKYP